MIKLEHIEVLGFEHAIRGLRNPMNSWRLSDSKKCSDFQKPECIGCNLIRKNLCNEIDENDIVIGKNDLQLMQKLFKAGTDHRKFMRMITVYMDITAPLYWWKEFDTYKVGTVANSCSTMHKIHDKEFTFEDFSCEHLDNSKLSTTELVDVHGCDTNIFINSKSLLNITIAMLNNFRKKYIETIDKNYWWQIIQLLPSSYNQKRTVMLNYEVLANMYHSRKAHKLTEWKSFCDEIIKLPYIKEIMGDVG